MIKSDGTPLVLFATENRFLRTAVYIISLDDLLQKRIENSKIQDNSRLIFKDCCHAMLTAPILLDVNQDDITDIIISLDNSTIIALNGFNYEVLWTKQLNDNHTFLSIASGYFNHDSIPDLALFYKNNPVNYNNYPNGEVNYQVP